MTNISYESLLFSEIRTVVIDNCKNELTESNIVKAMTVNEEITRLGYTLTPADVVSLARSTSLDGFYKQVANLIGDVKAAPMYPNFPSQVMEMTEAQFRFHQMLHYMSTYGLELATGEPVLKGWLPDASSAVPKIKDDDILLKARRLSLITPSEKYIKPIQKILQKSERMTSKEKMMVEYAVKEMDDLMQLANVTVNFKQNLFILFYAIFDSNMSTEDKLTVLHGLCQHTGDVWKCVDYTLTHKNYHFKTSEKRLIVKLFESYTAEDFSTNIILSNKKAARVSLVLNYIDYNIYSRSEAHQTIVSSLRNGSLRSWESKAKKLLAVHSDEAIEYLAERPGVLLRNIAWLVRLGYSAAMIKNTVLNVAAKLNTQTLLSLINQFDKNNWEDEQKEKEGNIIFGICTAAIAEKMKSFDTAFKGKKIFIDDTGYCLERSLICCKDKSDEGGYLRNGLAIRIPENINRLRFFVYWNDKTRVDVDLHSQVRRTNGKPVDIGWNSNRIYKDLLAFSGDITHSDAAEYIDINMESPEIESVSANVHLYSGKPSFKDVDECFVGMMAVNKLDEDVKLYSPANCFFSHYLTSNTRNINYGYIDVQSRLLFFAGEGGAEEDWYSGTNKFDKDKNRKFSLKTYLTLLADAQGALIVDKKEDADYVLVMERPGADNELSILDENFFIEE